MDVEVALRKVREWAQTVSKTGAHTDTEREAAEHFEALDEWLTRGGFLPADWVR